MAFRDLFTTLLNRMYRSPARREQLAYMRSIPLRRLLLLGLAIMLLFTGVGLLSAIRSESAQNYLVTGFVTAIYTGCSVGFYTVIGARRPVWLLAVIPFHIVSMFALRVILPQMEQHLTPVSFEEATRLYALCALIATAASYSLFFRFIQTEGRHAFRVRAELALAHTIQATLVPAIAVNIAGCDVYGLSLPSAKVGGDLVDVIASSSGGGFAYLVDVAGHGLNAGILMGMVKTAVRTCLAYESAPGKIFDTLNGIMPGVKEAHMYATCAALQLRRGEDGRCEITYALAGHPPILHLSSLGEVKARLSDEQFPLGLLPFSGYETRAVAVVPGDLLLSATDGILETCGKDGIDFGADGVERLVAANVNLPLPVIGEKIFAAAAKIGPQNDDRTLLLIRVL